MSEDIIGKKILILGAGTWLVHHIKRAKELGLKTFVTDWSASAEGKKYADVFEQIDIKDKEASLRFARKHKVDAIYTSADIGVQTAAYIAKKMNLYYHTEELAICATNKLHMRNKAKEFGLGIPKYLSAENLEEAKVKAKDIGYPVIIKPLDNCSSRGVVVVNNDDEMELQFQETKSHSGFNFILIEELLVGIEGSIEAIIVESKATILGISDREKSELPYRYDTQINYPGNYTEKQLEQIKQFIDDLVTGYEIKQGIIHTEIIVNDVVYLVEFGLRSGGSKIITHLLANTLDFDIVEHQIYNSFNIKKAINIKKKYHGILKFILLPDGKIKSIKGVDKVLKTEGVIDFDIERKAGDLISTVKDGRSRPGYLLVQGKSRKECEELIEKITSLYKVEYEN